MKGHYRIKSDDYSWSAWQTFDGQIKLPPASNNRRVEVCYDVPRTDAADYAIEVMQRFVDKVDAGAECDIETYGAFQIAMQRLKVAK